jgi:hypothetical protein
MRCASGAQQLPLCTSPPFYAGARPTSVATTSQDSPRHYPPRAFNGWGYVAQHDVCHQQLTLDRPARAHQEEMPQGLYLVRLVATRALASPIPRRISCPSPPGEPADSHAQSYAREVHLPFRVLQLFLIPQLVRADGCTGTNAASACSHAACQPPSGITAVQQLLRGAPAAIPRGGASVTREATRKPRGPAHRLQDLFDTRNERILGRPPGSASHAFTSSSTREARQRSDGPGHDGIPDPQRVHGRTRVERHEASSPSKISGTHLAEIEGHGSPATPDLSSVSQVPNTQRAPSHPTQIQQRYTPQLSAGAVRAHRTHVHAA